MVDVVGLRFVAEGERDATNALKRYAAAQDKLKTSVLDAANRVQRTAVLWERANQLNKDGVLSTRALTAAQTQAARQLAVLNGYVTKSGAINTQYAKSLLRAEQATRDAARAAKEKVTQDRLAAQASEQAARAVARQDAADRKAYQQYLRYQREKAQAASQAAREIEQAAQREARAQREAAQETARLAAETEMLARAYNPLMTATNVYEREVQQLNRAHQLGVLSADALEAKLGELQVAYARVGDGTMKAQNFVNQFGSVTQLAGVKTNRFGMVAQQVGYQVGDFFVQIQSGTNAFVAFGQQATQLAGLLPGLAGAIVGISISVGTMLLAAYDRTRRAAQDFESTTFDINEATKSATEELKNYREELAKLASEYKTLGEIGLDKQIQALDAELKNLEGRRAAITGAAATGFGAAGGMMSGADLEEMVGDALRANTEEIDEQIRSKREQLRLLVLERESVEAVKIQLGEQNQLLRDGAAAALDRNSSFRQSRLELERELTLIQMAARFGEDSAMVATKRAYYEALMRGYTKDQRDAYIALVLKIREAEQELQKAKDNAEDLSDEIASTDLSSLTAQASLLAANMGVAADEAARYNAALNQQAGIPDNTGQPRLGFGGLGSVEDGAGLGTGFARLGFGNLDEPRLRTRTPMATPAGRGGGGGGGGGGAAREQEDYLKNLLLEAEQKRKLVGLTEDETRRQEILFELKKRELPLNDARIEQIIQTEAQTRLLMEAEQKRQQLMQTVEGHIENAFMSWVDGSQSVEDAFKGMLRNILLAIYQQQVAEPAARAVGGLLAKAIPALFSANGNVFSGGAHVTAYANGGVVNAPTMFQHSGGLGVMGEAGPEAIMPLKRGANGKLGVQMEGGAEQPVVVNQYFQLSANGDESVRRIVRQEAPRMAEMAKSAVVDAKRRGGSYGRSF